MRGEDLQMSADKLSRLPGFGDVADRLLSEVMVRRSRLADDYDELVAAEQGLADMRKVNTDLMGSASFESD